MSNDIFDLLAELEIFIVELYAKAKNLYRLKNFTDTFQLMETVSANHSQKIKEIGDKTKITGFDRSAVINMHHKIRDKLWNDIINENDENEVLRKMSVSEESVGKLYLAISAYYEKISEEYKILSTEIQSIANEEFDHRDGLLKLLKY